jgi:hypothetical protein
LYFQGKKLKTFVVRMFRRLTKVNKTYLLGIVIVNSLPTFTSECTSIFPSCFSIIFWDIASPKPVPTPTEIPVPTQTVAPTQTPVPQETEAPTQTPTPEPTATVAPTATPEPTIAAVRVQIVIVKGNTASKVCKMIEEAGIISDWEEFRDYLKSRNLVNEINVGKFTLSGDMTFEEIAKIITGK